MAMPAIRATPTTPPTTPPAIGPAEGEDWEDEAADDVGVEDEVGVMLVAPAGLVDSGPAAFSAVKTLKVPAADTSRYAQCGTFTLAGIGFG